VGEEGRDPAIYRAERGKSVEKEIAAAINGVEEKKQV
jgi:hypothetical protein